MHRKADFGSIHYVSSVVEKLPSPDCRRAHCLEKRRYTFSESPLRQHAKDILEIRELARDPVYQFKASSLPEDPFGGSPYCYLDNPELCSFRQAAELKDWLLGRAALEGATEVCQYLLDHGASLSTRTGGLAVIHMAAIGGCAGVLAVLKSKQSLELRDDDGHAPLHHAVVSGSAGCVFWLLSSDVHLDSDVKMEILSKKGKNGEEVFKAYSAYQNGESYCDKTELVSPVETSSANDSKMTALEQNLAASQTEVKLLLSQASVDRGKNAVLKMELTERKKREAKLEKELEQGRRALSASKIEWRNREEELRLKLSEKEGECKCLRKQLTDLSAEVTQLKSKGENRARISVLTANENEMKTKLWSNYMEVQWLKAEFSASGCVLEPDSLEAEQQNLFLSLAKKLGHDWKCLGVSLNVTDAQLDNIEYRNRFSLKICAYEMLKTWCFSKGKVLVTDVLISALANSERGDLVELVEDQMERSS